LELRPRPHWEGLPLAVFRGLLRKGREGDRRGEKRKGGGEGRGGREFVFCPRKKRKVGAAPINAAVHNGVLELKFNSAHALLTRLNISWQQNEL